MVAESVKKAVKEIFETHVKDLKKCSHKDTDRNSDSENEHYHMEDVGLDLEDVNVSETFALSDLCKPPQKCQKTNQLTPVIVALINTWLGKSRYKKIRILLYSRSSRSIILEKFVKNCICKMTPPPVGLQKEETFKCPKVQNHIILKEFFENQFIEWNLHVDSTPGLHWYNMILGCDIMSELGITLNFKDQTMTWDDLTINMKDPELYTWFVIWNEPAAHIKVKHL